MAFIELPGDQDVANLARLFAPRPAVYRAWRQLSDAIQADMDARRYELATVAAAPAVTPPATPGSRR